RLVWSNYRAASLQAWSFEGPSDSSKLQHKLTSTYQSTLLRVASLARPPPPYAASMLLQRLLLFCSILLAVVAAPLRRENREVAIDWDAFRSLLAEVDEHSIHSILHS